MGSVRERTLTLIFLILTATAPKSSALQNALRGNLSVSQPNLVTTHDIAQRISDGKSGRKLNTEATQNFTDRLQDGVSVIVPGLGGYSRASLVLSNIQWLKQQGIDFDCTIYVYRDEQSFPLQASDYEPCKLIRHPGFWMEHLLAFPLQSTRKKYVVHLLDGVRLGPEVQLSRILSVMSANDLAHAAPSCVATARAACMPHMMHRPGTGVGRFTDMIELQFDVFTRENFACLQDIMPTDNKLGWGVGKVMAVFCGGKLGILDEMTQQKEFGGSYSKVEAKAYMTKWFSKSYPDVVFPQGTTLGMLMDPARPEDLHAMPITPPKAGNRQCNCDWADPAACSGPEVKSLCFGVCCGTNVTATVQQEESRTRGPDGLTQVRL